MKTCDHEWIVFSTAMMPPAIMVNCAKCFAIGGVLDHTDEEWELAFYASSMPFRWAAAGRVILQDDLPEPTPDDMRLVQDFLNHAEAGDFTTLSHTDDDFDEAGTMGWLPAADERSGQTSIDGDDLGFVCTHAWAVRYTMHDPSDRSNSLELECDHCGATAYVHGVTSEEAAGIEDMWRDCLHVNWWDVGRVVFSATPPAEVGQTSLDGDPLIDYDLAAESMIADLVNALDLFEGDDDDIPF